MTGMAAIAGNRRQLPQIARAPHRRVHRFGERREADRSAAPRTMPSRITADAVRPIRGCSALAVTRISVKRRPCCSVSMLRATFASASFP